MSNKVVTITLNPALDLTGSLEVLNLGSVSLAERSSLHAAGKGVNVARVLRDLGADVTVTGFLGQDNQEMFCQLFAEIGVHDQFVRVEGATRINVKLVEKSGAVSDINFPGVNVTSQDIVHFETTLFELAQSHDFFVLAGSLPKGISAQLCASWIRKLNDMGKKVIFDSSRDALSAGIAAQPWLIKPNDEELSFLVNKPLASIDEITVAALQASNYIENVVVSLGEKGVLWHNNGQWLHASPPSMQVVSTVGAGDTLVAGLCWGQMQEMSKPRTLSLATALSALAVEQVGVGIHDLEAVHQLQHKIQVASLATPVEIEKDKG